MIKRRQTEKKHFKPSLLIVLGIVIIVAMITQLAFLSIFGTKGKEVAKIRERQREIIL